MADDQDQDQDRNLAEAPEEPSSDAPKNEIFNLPTMPRAGGRRKSIYSGVIQPIASAASVEKKVASLSKNLGFSPDPLPNSKLLNQLPFLLVIARGLLMLREAWHLYTEHEKFAALIDPKERQLRMMTALTGGLVTVGGCIVNILMQFQVGLLAGAQAAVIAPIVFSCLGLGCFCMSLFRDLYRIQQCNQLIATQRSSMDLLDETEKLSASAVINKATNDRYNLIKDIIFGGIGTLGTIIVLSISFVSLATVSTAGFGSLLLLSSALIALSTAPTAIDLLSRAWNGIKSLFEHSAEKSADNTKTLTPSKEPPSKTVGITAKNDASYTIKPEAYISTPFNRLNRGNSSNTPESENLADKQNNPAGKSPKIN